MIKKILLVFLLIFIKKNSYTQIIEKSATYYASGVNSPWMIGIDYDFGFGKIFSINMQISGGISSQVNRASNFGEVFLGELQIGPRLYMNPIDTWTGLFLSTVIRIGIYSIPIRSQDNPFTDTSRLIIDRSTMLQYGLGIYFGYKWKRNLVTDMSNLPFTMIIEPYLGWSLDFLNPLDSIFTQQGKNINRFSVGITFKIGFYTHKKSKETLEREETERIEKEVAAEKEGKAQAASAAAAAN
ncbi:MAG: hypothetical protein KFW21_00025 [Spirochaetota bacterium]|nr:hypothetical protein [Spirochaetota bacterium]